METNLEPPPNPSTTTFTTATNFSGEAPPYNDDDYISDSNCSTPYVSAPSSPPSRPSSFPFFFSAPASPMHYVLSSAAPSRSSAALAPSTSDASSSASFEFEFSSRFSDSPAPEISVPAMSSADELFLNGQIRPMKLSAHLQHPQSLSPLLDLDESDEIDPRDDNNGDRNENDDVFRVSRLRTRSQRRRTRSLSPLRSTTPFDWLTSDDAVSTPTKPSPAATAEESETTPSTASSSRCSSAGRSSKRWIFLKDFLRSKSEGRSNNKFWHNFSLNAKEKVKERERSAASFLAAEKARLKKEKATADGAPAKKAAAAAKRRSAAEMHYAANRAQAEEMRKKTFLPYRQGLLGCLGFNSKSYGALNGFARALNPVSSR